METGEVRRVDTADPRFQSRFAEVAAEPTRGDGHGAAHRRTARDGGDRP